MKRLTPDTGAALVNQRHAVEIWLAELEQRLTRDP